MSYPLNKELAGNAAWRTMHHRASLYSDNPTPKEKERMKYFLLESMKGVAELCKNCKNDIKDYLHKHPLESSLDGKRQLSRYLCEFHNHVNEKKGKEIHNCHLIVGKKPVCTDCEKTVSTPDSEPVSLKESLQHFKDVSAKVFKALCNKYKLPIPNIRFHHCPDSPETSCASMLVDNTTNEIVEKPTIYLHPNVYGLRTIFHEFIHYAKQLKKDSLGTMDEMVVEKETQELLNEEFPFDKPDQKRIGMAAPLIVRDTFTSRLHNFPRASKMYSKYLRNTKRHDFPVSNGESGDWIFDMVNDVTNKQEEMIEHQQRQQEEQRNAFSFLDPVYAPFANLLGIKASDLNRNNSPTLVTNAAMTLVKSNMTPLGSLLLSTLASFGTFAALVAGKNGINYGDRVLLNFIGSSLLWSNIDYMRPEGKEEIIEEAVTLGQVVSEKKWDLIPNLLIDSPFFASLATGTETPSSASPLSAKRNVQRAAGGGIGRGASGGVGGRSSSSPAAAAVQQQIAEERYIAGLRNQQRLQPGGVAAPAAPYTKDVPTGAAGGNPAGKGGNIQQTGVVDTDYMGNTVIIPDEYGEYDDAVVESQFGARVSSSDIGGAYYGEQRGPREDFIELESPETKRNTIREIYYPGQDIGEDELDFY